MLHPLPDCGAREKISDALKVHKALALSHIPIAPTLSKLISPLFSLPLCSLSFRSPFLLCVILGFDFYLLPN